jgi:hypothetical protein
VLLDEGVPAEVASTFLRHGHEVVPFEDVLVRGSPDDVVCSAALANDAILVAFDNDMKQLVARQGITADRFKRLSLLKFACDEPMAAKRLDEAMSLVEHEWAVSDQKVGRRLFVVIGKNVIRTHR